jgi:hypothetical protein
MEEYQVQRFELVVRSQLLPVYVHAENFRLLRPRQVISTTTHRFRTIDWIDPPVVGSGSIGVAAWGTLLPVIGGMVSMLT